MKDGGEVAKAVLEILQQSSKENIVEAAKSAKSADIDIDVSEQIHFNNTYFFGIIDSNLKFYHCRSLVIYYFLNSKQHESLSYTHLFLMSILMFQARLLEVANSEIKEDADNMIQQQKDIYQKWQDSRDQELKR